MTLSGRVPAVALAMALGACAGTDRHLLVSHDAPADVQAADANGPDALSDGRTDDGAVLVPPFGTGRWEFGTIAPLDDGPLDPQTKDLVLSADGLTAWFSSSRGGGQGGHDIWQMTRADRDALAFSTPTNLGALNSDMEETAFSQNAAGKAAVLVTTAPGAGGAANVWWAHRDSVTSPWQLAWFAPSGAINTDADEWDAVLSSDGHRLYFASSGWRGVGGSDLLVAERATLTEGFAAPTHLETVNSVESDVDPTVTTDERVIVFVSQRPAGKGGADLWWATRSDVSEPFGTPQPIEQLNTADAELEPSISADGRELIFRRFDGSRATYLRAEILAGP